MKKTAKQKLYEQTVRMVERLVNEGMPLTKARTNACVRMGLSYPTVFTITKHLSGKQAGVA